MNAVIGALRVVLGLDSAAFEKGLSQAQTRAAKFGASLKTGLMAAGAAAVTAGAALGLALKGALDEADEMSKMASKFGVPIEELSRLKYAADLSGVSIEGVGGAFKKLSSHMAEAAEGNEAAADLFSKLGVAATDSDGKLRASSAVLLDVADKFAKMEDGAAKTALAVKLFGKSGLDMIPLLNGGAAGLKAMTDEADALGLTISASTGKAAEQFNDNISRLQATLSGMVTQIAANLAPTLATITDFLVQLSTAFQNLSPQTQTFISVGGALTVALAALAVPVGLVAAGIAAIGLPIAGVIAGITALTAAAIAFWPEIQAAWEWVTKFTEVMIRLHTEALVAVISKFKELGGAIVSALAGVGEEVLSVFRALPGQMIEIGGQIIDGLWQGIKAKWESVKGGVRDIAAGIKDTITGFFDIHSPSRVMAEIGGHIMQGLSDGIAGMKGSVVGAASDVTSSVGSAFQGMESIGQTLSSSFSSAVQGIVDGSKKIKDVLKDLLMNFAKSGIDTALKGITGSLFGGLGGGFKATTTLGNFLQGIPGFANGGSILPGGAGGIDSQLMMFRKSPTEQVDIYDPRKLKAAGAAPSIRGGDIIIQGDVSERNMAAIRREIAANNQRLAEARDNEWRR